MRSNCAAMLRPCFSLELTTTVKPGLRTSIQFAGRSRADATIAASSGRRTKTRFSIAAHPRQQNETLVFEMPQDQRKAGNRIPVRVSVLRKPREFYCFHDTSIKTIPYLRKNLGTENVAS